MKLDIAMALGRMGRIYSDRNLETGWRNETECVGI
jgi:hypothetical protein